MPTTSYYLVTGALAYNNTNLVADKQYYAAIQKNAVNVVYGLLHSSHIASIGTQLSTIAYFTANDLITLAGWHSSGADTITVFGYENLTSLGVFLLQG